MLSAFAICPCEVRCCSSQWPRQPPQLPQCVGVSSSALSGIATWICATEIGEEVARRRWMRAGTQGLPFPSQQSLRPHNPLAPVWCATLGWRPHLVASRYKSRARFTTGGRFIFRGRNENPPKRGGRSVLANYAARDAGRGRMGFFFGAGRRPSRCACFLASFFARLIASPFSRTRRSEGFSYAFRAFISRKSPSRCIFFLSTLSAWSTLLSLTRTCNVSPDALMAFRSTEAVDQAAHHTGFLPRRIPPVAKSPSHESPEETLAEPVCVL